MKNAITFFLFFTLNLGYSQNDTIYIQNDLVNKIFILKDNHTEYHHKLKDFKAFPKNTFISKNNTLNSNWVPLYYLDNEYYLYIPCDVGDSQRIQISKKNITVESFEYYNCKILGNIIKYSSNHYGLKYRGFNKEKKWLDIYIIDDFNGIAVFKFTNKDQVFYQLMVHAEIVNDYNVIVNYCAFSKVEEFQFDAVDFQKLIEHQSFN